MYKRLCKEGRDPLWRKVTDEVWPQGVDVNCVQCLKYTVCQRPTEPPLTRMGKHHLRVRDFVPYKNFMAPAFSSWLSEPLTRPISSLFLYCHPLDSKIF